MRLPRRIASRGSEFLLFAITPPRLTVSPERAQEIADVTRTRLAGVDLDGVIIYDIDDESDRNPAERPFPFLPTIDPASFRAHNLADWSTPVVVYRAVGKYSESDLRGWLDAPPPEAGLARALDEVCEAQLVATLLFSPEGPRLLAAGVKPGAPPAMRKFYRALRALFHDCDPRRPDVPLLARRMGVLAEAAEGKFAAAA